MWFFSSNWYKIWAILVSRGLKRWKTYETVYIWAKKWILLFYLVDLWRHTERHLRHHRSWKQRLRKHSDARKCHPNKVGLNCRIPYHIVSLHILAVDIDCDFIICDNGDTGIEDCIMQVFEFIWWMKVEFYTVLCVIAALNLVCLSLICDIFRWLSWWYFMQNFCYIDKHWFLSLPLTCFLSVIVI